MFTRSLAQRLQTPALSIVLKFLFALLIVVEIYASLMPVDDTGIDLPHFDKVAHFIMHWVNMCVAGIVFIKGRSFMVAAVLLFLLGPAIEFMQGTLAHREASYADQVANTLGYLVGLLTTKRLFRGE
ncbi:MAG: VanZ family protein [Pseudomonadales bacterium]